MILRTISVIWLILFGLVSAPAAEQALQIDLYTSANCHSCQEVKEGILPRVKQEYGALINIEEFDIADMSNYARLLELQTKYRPSEKFDADVRTPTIFTDGKLLTGSNEINAYLEIYIDSALGRQGYRVVHFEEKHPGQYSIEDLVSRFKLIKPLGIISAGLIDGINPCAFTVVIFFISFLALQGYSRRQVLVIGVFFILAVFIIYVLIGLGLFSFLFKLKGYWLVVRLVYLGGALLCFVLAGLAFYDFLIFRRTQQAQDLILQLPVGLKQRIHRVIGLFYRRAKREGSPDEKPHILRLILSAAAVGCFVSLFEAVCTGQVYLPTVVFVLKSTQFKLKAFSYIILYNLMFILPLWLVLLFALGGTTSEQFSRFAGRHIGAVKILMSVLFLGLGLFLALQ